MCHPDPRAHVDTVEDRSAVHTQISDQPVDALDLFDFQARSALVPLGTSLKLKQHLSVSHYHNAPPEHLRIVKRAKAPSVPPEKNVRQRGFDDRRHKCGGFDLRTHGAWSTGGVASR